MIFNMLTSSRKNLGMIKIVPQWKIGPWLLCGSMYAVLKNLFFNSKLDLFVVLKANFKCDFWISYPKKYKGANFHEDWPYKTQVNNFVRYRKFKIVDFWKKALISRNIWVKFDQKLRGWVTKLKILSLCHRIVQNLLPATEALSLKISSHGTSLKWSWRLSQSAQE